jgi:hypothetical protein
MAKKPKKSQTLSEAKDLGGFLDGFGTTRTAAILRFAQDDSSWFFRRICAKLAAELTAR